MVAGADANLWFNNRSTTAAIGRITPQGVITEFGPGPGPGAGGGAEVGPVLGPDGNVWFTNHTTRSLPNVGTPPAVGRITPSGEITEYRAGMLYASSPDGIVAGPDGALWFTDRELRSIGRIVPISAPANTFLVQSAKRAGRKGVTQVPVTVPGPGEIRLDPVGLRSARNRLTRIRRSAPFAATAASCGPTSIRFALKGVARKRLRRYGFIDLKAKVTFAPVGGSPYSEYVSIPVALRRRRAARGRLSAGRRCDARRALWRARSTRCCGRAGRSRRSE